MFSETIKHKNLRALKNINFKIIAQKIGIAIIAVLVTSLIRKFFLGSLDDKVVWITFYPMVTIAAIIGVFFSGILTTVFTILIVVFQWNIFTTLR